MTPEESETFFRQLDWLVKTGQLVLVVRNYGGFGDGYETHTFKATATGWAASGGPVSVIYDQATVDEQWRKAREQDAIEADDRGIYAAYDDVHLKLPREYAPGKIARLDDNDDDDGPDDSDYYERSRNPSRFE